MCAPLTVYRKQLISPFKRMIRKYSIIAERRSQWIAITARTQPTNCFVSTDEAVRRLSYWHGASSRPLVGCTTFDVLRTTAESNGDRMALVSCHQNIQKTYTQFKDDVDKFAGGLLSLKHPIGTRLGIISTNVYEWIVAQFASAKIGWTLVNINPAYQIPELKYVLNTAGCAVLIVGEQRYSVQDFHAMMCVLVPGLEKADPRALTSELVPHLRNVISLGAEKKHGCISYEDMIAAWTPELDESADKINSSLNFDSVVNIQFSSGTTGKPKAIPLSHHGTVNNARLVGYWSGLADDTAAAVCLNVPLMHCFGCVIGSLNSCVHAAKIVMPSARFHARAALDAVTEHKCTLMLGTPTMYIDMLSKIDRSVHDLSSLHSGIMSGSPCLLTLREKVTNELGLKKLHIPYGSTEMSPVTTFTTPELLRQRPNSVGFPMDHVEVKIVDKERQIVPFETRGELCSRGYHVFREYLGDPDRTAEVLVDGWFHSGDEAIMSPDGSISITGRVKDMIIRGGENIYPMEIENFLMGMSEIEETHVCGVPDERMGEEVCAWIKVKEGKTLTEQNVKTFCKGELAHFKIPRYIVFTEDFPKTVSGKIQKFKMREAMCQRLTLDENCF